MILHHKRITKEQSIEMKQTCFDYASRNNNTNLRERHILMGLPEHPGFVCVEGNTNGWHIAGTQASLTSATRWLEQC